MPEFKVVSARPSGAVAVPFPSEEEFALEMESLRPVGAEIVTIDVGSDEEFVAKARDADALISGAAQITRTVIEGLERCKVIAAGGIGVDGLEVAAATEKGIPVTNVPDTFVEEVADHAMLLILSTHRRLPVLDRMTREGRWSEGRPMLYKHPRLFGLTLGLISFGNIARAVAMRAQPFGLRVVAFDPYVGEIAMTRQGVEPVGLTELLERSDIISMHAPYSSDTHHMMGEPQFRLMKAGALFINTGRGPTVDEAALVTALREGWIGAAGLDVFEKEPPDPDNPLLGLENVVLTTHAASASSRFDVERRRRVGREIALVLRGRWPMACVNPSVLEGTALRKWRPNPIF